MTCDTIIDKESERYWKPARVYAMPTEDEKQKNRGYEYDSFIITGLRCLPEGAFTIKDVIEKCDKLHSYNWYYIIEDEFRCCINCEKIGKYWEGESETGEQKDRSYHYRIFPEHTIGLLLTQKKWTDVIPECYPATLWNMTLEDGKHMSVPVFLNTVYENLRRDFIYAVGDVRCKLMDASLTYIQFYEKDE